MRFSFLIIAILIFSEVFSQDKINENKIFNDNIKTVLLYRDSWKFSYPIISLNSGERLILQFDDLSENTNDYSYTITHCNADWSDSGLNKLEYLNGFSESEITDFEPSFNALTAYNHYELTIPNEDMEITLSGNYLLTVYEDFDEEKIVFTRRFSVVSDELIISGEVKRSILDFNEGQEIKLEIIDTKNQISGASSELQIYVLQNNRYDNAKSDFQPTFIKGNRYIYERSGEIVFKGGSEYKNFNTKTPKYTTDRVYKVDFLNNKYIFELYYDEAAQNPSYSFWQDINGELFITAENVGNPQLEGEYVYVDFSLSKAPFLPEGDYYVFGAISNWKISKKNRMTYNAGTKNYECRMLLKQGFYDYKYVFATTENSEIQNLYAERNHYQTENNYVIYAYFRYPGKDYDELLATKVINSLKTD